MSTERARIMDVKASNVAPGASELRFRGAWLSRAGFSAGQAVKVSNPSPGIIEIRIVSEGAAASPGFEQAAAAALDQALAQSGASEAAELKETAFGEFKVQTLRPTYHGALCDTPECCANYWRQNIASFERYSPDKEGLYVLALNTRRRVIGHYLVADGTLDTILVHPREVFKPAMLASAAAIVCMHNHPSGDPSPSEADIKVTRELIKAGQLMKIEVLDHVVMGNRNYGRACDYTSLRELGYFYV